MKTQQFKSIDLRTIVTKLLNGQPINGVSVNTLYNLDSGDIDDDVTIIDEYTDKLQFMEYQISKREQLLKQKKGGIENETKKTDEPKKDPQTSERRTENLTEEKTKDEQLSNAN